ncbi:vWA domain-containing protein [Ectobacillus ponti]|uniref:VWFA domain-containing protein n=1 Tax=Ectobacillus ponti TaxID=2961894 RepID=A0AA42BSK3_9BACI|nr:hypothetical protein [Ectobacillus ponti]MCP8970629.1 hypothetical protein [Ectobacillus ponti]
MSLMQKLERIQKKKTNLRDRLGAKLPICILVDTSSSMNAHDNITRLNEGLGIYRQQLLDDPKTCDHIEIAIVEFGNGDTRLAVDFADLREQHFPVFYADGITPLCEAIEKGIEALDEQLSIYSSEGIICHPPHMIIMTDGDPTLSDRVDEEGYGIPLQNTDQEFLDTFKKFNRFKEDKGLVSITISIGDNIENSFFLEQFASSPENVLKMADKENIVEFFKLLSRSTSVLTRGVPNPGNKLDLVSDDSKGVVSPWNQIRRS